MKEKAEQMLIELKQQAAHFDEQLKMARGAIQAIEHLLAISKDEPPDGISNDEAD